ncbi:DNA cytosine methyltransferase [Vibrio cholerae]|nr:DNA cytosine methyltransferase [Vibrio cholerae]
MKVLIACEESQAVTIEFRKLGHEAYSCDLVECTGGHPEWHLKMCALDAINLKAWDMIIAFPPCTHLSAAGAMYWKQQSEDGRQQAAIDFVYAIRDSDCEFIAIENPTGKLNSVWRKPDQIINPFQFGEPFKKRTCLWLKGLPKLVDTDLVEPLYHYTSNSTRGGKLKDGTRKKSNLPIYKPWDSSRDRSKTFTGIAKAMASQWGCLELKGR